MDFHNVYPIYVFKVKESTADIPTELLCLSDLKNSSQLPYRKVLMIYCLYKIMIVTIFQTIRVFEVRESIADIFTKLPCLSYLENLGQFPVQGYFEGSDTCILWIFRIFSLFMFSRSRSPLLTFLLSYYVWVTSIIQVNFRFERYWWFCLMNFWNFHTIRVFRGQGIHCWYFYRATVFG